MSSVDEIERAHPQLVLLIASHFLYSFYNSKVLILKNHS